MADTMTDAGVILTDKEICFCDNYVIHWNATRAAKTAGYAEASAHNQGSDLLVKDNIKKYIQHLKSKTQELAGVSMLRNAQVLRRIAYAKSSGTKDRIKAIEILNKMFGYNSPEQLEHSGTINIPPIKWVE